LEKQQTSSGASPGASSIFIYLIEKVTALRHQYIAARKGSTKKDIMIKADKA
jgi:hypothetical protein